MTRRITAEPPSNAADAPRRRLRCGAANRRAGLRLVLGPPAMKCAVAGAAISLATMGCRNAGRPPAAVDAGLEPASGEVARSPGAPLPGANLGRDGARSLAEIAEKVLPSVVSVASTRVAKTDAPTPDLPFDNPFFRRFFGPDLPFGFPGPGGPPGEPVRGLGSGVIVTRDTVLTNAHVVEDSKEITVTLKDERELSAKVVGTDPKSDLAVLKLEGDLSGVRPIALGDSSRMRLGDVVLAVGNPFGVGQTVTMGIVSAKGRANVGIVDYEDFIQTDAAINPGNSGGALVDSEGSLIGIPTAILSRSGGYMGIGFAIPANMAKPIMQSLIEHGKVVRGWLGVTIQDVDRALAEALGLPSAAGVLVSDVSKDSPAGKAGLERGDVILSVDGKAVNSTGALRNLVAAGAPGSSTALEILRKGQKRRLTVVLGEAPATGPEGGKPGETPDAPSNAAGISVMPLSPPLRERFEIPNSVESGVVVTAVEPGSPAAAANLRPGDVVVEVDRKRVTGVEDLRKFWDAARGPTPFVISRQGSTIYMVVRKP